MSRRGHPHLAWESQPLLRPASRRHGHAMRLAAIAFIIGLLVGVIIGLRV